MYQRTTSCLLRTPGALLAIEGLLPCPDRETPTDAEQRLKSPGNAHCQSCLRCFLQSNLHSYNPAALSCATCVSRTPGSAKSASEAAGRTNAAAAAC
eukprot:3470018-Pleurochrysis_carterae.AAC.2